MHTLAFLDELARTSGKRFLKRTWLQKLVAAVHLSFADLILTSCQLAERSIEHATEIVQVESRDFRSFSD